MSQRFVLCGLLALVFQLGDSTVSERQSSHAKPRTALRRGCAQLSWNELLWIAEIHSEGARKCLERFLAEEPKSVEGLLAAVLLEEWEKDPDREGELQVPRPLQQDSNCLRSPQIKREIETVKPHSIEFEVWVNRHGQARWARVVYRFPSIPAPLFEKCELEFALQQKYRPAWKGHRFVAHEFTFKVLLHYKTL